jgi:hypothetical protein
MNIFETDVDRQDFVNAGRQERSREIGAGGAVAPGNNLNAAVDFGTTAYGHLEAPECEAAPMEESERDYSTDRSKL